MCSVTAGLDVEDLARGQKPSPGNGWNCFGGNYTMQRKCQEKVIGRKIVIVVNI
jgi:hypothetical protein